MNDSARLCRTQREIGEASIDGEIVLLDIETGKFFGLRGTAIAIWKLVDGTRTVDEIKNWLRDLYAVDTMDCDREVDLFLASLCEAGLAEAV